MTLEHAIGDLFTSGADAIGHGVNCRGLMGAGIAAAFRARMPGLLTDYQAQCRTGGLTLGGCYAWQNPLTKQWVYNLASQDRPGPHAKLSAVRSSVATALTHAEYHGIASLGVPRIGAGIGGLVWDDVAAVLADVASASPVRLIVVTLPSASSKTGHRERPLPKQ